MSENIREIVFDSLLLWEKEKRKSHLLIREVLDKYDYLNNSDKNFIKRLFEGTIQKMITLDYCLNKYSDREIKKCKPEIRVILRMSAYQILYMDRVPDSAAINEAGNICKKRSRKELLGFVNAVLRKLSENKEKVTDFSTIEDRLGRLSVTYSQPEDIVKLFIKEIEKPEELLESLSKERPTVARILSENKDEILSDWEKKGISFAKSSISEDAYILENVHGIADLPGFNEGKVYIQDESSMLCVKKALENEKRPLALLDLCAAPGGKTVMAASLLDNESTILSCDVSDNKVSLIKENIERLGFTNVSFKVNDATVYNEEFFEAFDVVICDVPCSGLGVLQRKSDIKYRITNEEMKEICDLQKSIADNAVKYVKKGGVLLYSTCTIHKAENEKAVKRILSKENFSVEYEKQLLPHIDNTDGFYIAKLRKHED